MPGLSTRKLSVVVNKAVGDIQTTVSKRQLLLAIPIVVACAAWVTNIWLNSAVGGVPGKGSFQAVWHTLVFCGGPVVLAGYTFPDFTYSKADKIGFALVAALNFVLMAAWEFIFGYLFLLLYMHLFVYGPRQEAHAPPTYLKYLAVPMYILSAALLIDFAVTGGKNIVYIFGPIFL